MLEKEITSLEFYERYKAFAKEKGLIVPAVLNSKRLTLTELLLQKCDNDLIEQFFESLSLHNKENHYWISYDWIIRDIENFEKILNKKCIRESFTVKTDGKKYNIKPQTFEDIL